MRTVTEAARTVAVNVLVILLAALVAVLLGAFVLPTGAFAAGACPNEQLRAEDPPSQALPDCRAYEQVSPVDKNLADLFGAVTSVRGAPSGQAVTFNSLIPYPPHADAHEGSSELFSFYMSSRTSEAGNAKAAWLTADLNPAANPGSVARPVAVTEDLSDTLVQSSNEPPLVVGGPEVIEGREAIYLRNNATGSYRLLFQSPPNELLSFFFVAAVDNDSRVFFESADQLTSGIVGGTRNLYEWHEGHLDLVDVLPESESGLSDGGAAGLDGPGAAEGGSPLPDGTRGHISYFAQNAVSGDGSRVFFTNLEGFNALGAGRLYMREPQAERTVPISEGRAAWQAATPDGSHVFYIEHGALYKFDVEGGRGKRERLTNENAGVLGVLGIASDGSYVYFASTAVLTLGAAPGRGNIYVWHEGPTPQEGTISLVTDEGAVDDWTPHTLLINDEGPSGPDEGVKTSRVSTDGRTLMFTSRGSVTGYNNQGEGNDCVEDEGAAPCNEIYIYEAGTGRVMCVSCNPAGVPATSDALLYHREDPIFLLPPTLFPYDLPRNLSVDGSRVFFETEEALLPKDTNGAMDIYEWEREGTGSCGVGQNSGCLYLISTGQSDGPSFFAEASASGGDVWFFTRQSLVGQDDDELVDMYDAREGGGIASQDASAGVAPCLGEACRAAQGPPPVAGVPVSQVFSGPGNLVPPVEAGVVAKATPRRVKCKKGFVEKKGKCVKKPKPKPKKVSHHKGSK